MKKYYGIVTACMLLVGVCGMLTACQNDKAGEQTDSVTEAATEEQSATYAALAESSAAQFSLADLQFENVQMGMTIEQVEAAFGKPVAVNDQAGTIYQYDGFTLTFAEVAGKQQLCEVDCISSTYHFARGLKVGMTQNQVIDTFYRDANCLNSNVLSADGATIVGKFLYGDKTLGALDSGKITDKLQYGMINYNGRTTFENGDCIIEYTYMEPPYKGEQATYYDDFAQLMIHMNEQGMVKEICWYYYPEMDEQK